ncbi:MAG: imidazole glycerol phosphate synthase subunit HisH [Gammaproteobacteria bacterium]|jgi:glutamine amidotransferase|nr:imidazole glycerol phosphate synthase subunit HisH [Gammaproteobacteria bacterium]
MRPSVIIVDYEAGNLRSVQRACEAVGLSAEISADPEVVRHADRLIFPGVGTAETAMGTLARLGLDEALVSFFQSGRPLLGICLGLQVLLDYTEEGGRDCLGIIPGQCKRFQFVESDYKVPQIGWNEVSKASEHPLMAGVPEGAEFYFVHAYYAIPDQRSHVLAETTFGDKTFASVIGRDNVFATQFHLEKSGRFGLELLAAFGKWDGAVC